MTIQIDSIVLPDVIWKERIEPSGVDTRTEKTLSGRSIVWEQASQGQMITLEGGMDFAWILKSALDSLKIMSDIPNARYELIYEGETFNVRFRNEERPAVSATPINPRPNQASTDLYNNVLIKLMEV